jgi:hypothetical protein
LVGVASAAIASHSVLGVIRMFFARSTAFMGKAPDFREPGVYPPHTAE